MFVSGTAVIRVKRTEPAIKDVAFACEVARRRNSLIAEKVVTQSLLRSKPKSKEKSASKIAKGWEREKRIENVEQFLVQFNQWRKFYVQADNEWIPKNSGQLTCIENIMEFCEKRDVDLGLYIACQFKALAWKPATPTVQQMQSNGVANYNQYIEDVLLDIDEVEYTESGYE